MLQTNRKGLFDWTVKELKKVLEDGFFEYSYPFALQETFGGARDFSWTLKKKGGKMATVLSKSYFL